MLLLVWLATEITGRGFGHFSRDPASVGRGLQYYTGALSYATVLVCWTGASVAVFAGFARRRHRNAVPLLVAGALAGWLALDDLFLLHEAFFPRRGVPERLVVGSYGVAAVLYVLIFRDFLRRTEWILPLSAAALLVAANAFDAADRDVAWEDGAKFLGIVGLAAFLVRVSASLVREAPATEPGASPG